MVRFLRRNHHGTIQTLAMPECSVEIATGTDEPMKDTGFILHGGCPFPFSADAIWARAAGSHAVLNVVPGKLPM